ncbi:MAG: hypothetical protein JXX28_05515 [Deltaproteobacteria bacterium]|nr:hypothetical protein [Deltaproteobacteria bacterium]
MLVLLLSLACSEPEPEPESAPHPCDAGMTRQVSWSQTPSSSGIHLPTAERSQLWTDDFVVPEEDGCWCVETVTLWSHPQEDAYWSDRVNLYFFDDSGPGAPEPRNNGGSFGPDDCAADCPKAATGEPTTFRPVNDDPEDGRTRPVVMLLPGRHWFTVDTTSTPVENAEGFLWPASDSDTTTEPVWTGDTEGTAIYTDSTWTPWSDVAPDSPVRDLAFEIHAVADKEVCQAWLDENPWYLELF